MMPYSLPVGERTSIKSASLPYIFFHHCVWSKSPLQLHRRHSITISTNSYTPSATTLPYILSKRFTWPAQGRDDSRSCTEPTSMLDCSSRIPANDSGHKSNTTHHHPTHETRQISAAASDPGPQSSYGRSNHSAFKSCHSCNFSKNLRNVPEDLNYSIRRFLELPWRQPVRRTSDGAKFLWRQHYVYSSCGCRGSRPRYSRKSVGIEESALIQGSYRCWRRAKDINAWVMHPVSPLRGWRECQP